MSATLIELVLLFENTGALFLMAFKIFWKISRKFRPKLGIRMTDYKHHFSDLISGAFNLVQILDQLFGP